jgi:hypothetical protein
VLVCSSVQTAKFFCVFEAGSAEGPRSESQIIKTGEFYFKVFFGEASYCAGVKGFLKKVTLGKLSYLSIKLWEHLSFNIFTWVNLNCVIVFEVCFLCLAFDKFMNYSVLGNTVEFEFYLKIFLKLILRICVFLEYYSKLSQALFLLEN